jgi:hypothetical protein
LGPPLAIDAIDALLGSQLEPVFPQPRLGISGSNDDGLCEDTYVF